MYCSQLLALVAITNVGVVDGNQLHESSSQSRVTMEQGAHTSDLLNGWKQLHRSNTSEPIKVLFMLRHNEDRLKLLEETFWAVADPRNEKYGDHLSRDELSKLLMPNEGQVSRVLDWLTQHVPGVQPSQPNVDMIEASLNIGAAEQLFGTEFYAFRHIASNTLVHRIGSSYSLPPDIAAAVQIVGNIARLPSIRTPILVPSTPGLSNADANSFPAACSTCNPSYVTPAVLGEAYKITDAWASLKPAPGNRMGTSEWDKQYWNQKDLDNFRADCALGANVTVDHQIGSNGSPGAMHVPLISDPSRSIAS
jgi:tripeptidyl-peptidase-1